MPRYNRSISHVGSWLIETENRVANVVTTSPAGPLEHRGGREARRPGHARSRGRYSPGALRVTREVFTSVAPGPEAPTEIVHEQQSPARPRTWADLIERSRVEEGAGPSRQSDRIARPIEITVLDRSVSRQPELSRGSSTEPSNNFIPPQSRTAPVPKRPVSMKRLAEDASILLEVFSQSSPDNEDDMDDEHQNMISNAADGIIAIQARLRQNVARRNGDIGVPHEAKGDADCVICYSENADTLFMPCKHLVVCTVRKSILHEQVGWLRGGGSRVPR
ncbi:hypothetical protein Q9L58_001926 [Maublancomyces gigas]|uniref:Uncharacterized protein n=1 Tax=Discina gigas TaxID=1032678 RepID=A0ABR3GSZ9_9PEZI